MMVELDADGKHNSVQISEIDLTDPEDARVLMPEQGADVLAHFGEDHFLERYQRYQAHIAGWRQQYPHLAAVDLRYDNQVVLEMASGKETAETASGDAVIPPATPNPDAKPMTDTKQSGTKTMAAKTSGAKTSDASAAKKTKPAQDKKHAVPAKRAAAQSTTKRNSASTTRPASTNPGNNSRPVRASAAIVAQGG
jgi:cell division protein FtsQ